MRFGRPFALPFVLALLIAGSSYAQTTSESKINIAPYGFIKTDCAWYPGAVEFLDNEHLMISAPVVAKCDKSLWDSPTDTVLTVIKLNGEKVASSHRSDVISMFAGPVGYAGVCVGDHVELLSVALEVAASIPLSAGRKVSPCYVVGTLTPSRNAIAIAGPEHHQFSLYRMPLEDTTIDIPNGYNVRGAADDGFLLCLKGHCDVFGPSGVRRSFPSMADAFESDIRGLITQDRLLIADRSGKRLYTVTPAGDQETVADLTKIKPPFVGSSGVQLSASEPRRMLYRVDGCLLGDFDDCYGEVFHRFAVFDSQSGHLLLRHSYAPKATLRISPDGRTILERDGAELRLFRVP